MVDFFVCWNPYQHVSVLTSLIPAVDKEAFRPCRRSVDTTVLSTKKIEDPVSHIASLLSLKIAFANLMRNTGSVLCVIFVATAVVVSGAPVVASFFFEKPLCKICWVVS